MEIRFKLQVKDKVRSLLQTCQWLLITTKETFLLLLRTENLREDSKQKSVFRQSFRTAFRLRIRVTRLLRGRRPELKSYDYLLMVIIKCSTWLPSFLSANPFSLNPLRDCSPPSSKSSKEPLLSPWSPRSKKRVFWWRDPGQWDLFWKKKSCRCLFSISKQETSWTKESVSLEITFLKELDPEFFN